MTLEGGPLLTLTMRYTLAFAGDVVWLSFIDDHDELERWHSEDDGHHWARA